MKSLIQYINEEYDIYRIKNLEVIFNCNDDITFQVPESYSEDDFQIYLQDAYLNELPAGDKTAKDFFGKNVDNLYDVLFEYDKYEKSDEEPKEFVEFNTNLDADKSDEKMTYISLEGLRYIIKFDKFDLNVNDEDEIPNVLNTIFKTCESNDTNEWPLELILDEKNIKYT